MKALLKVDNLDAYEAILKINDVEIMVFVSICPYKVTVNNVYTVKLYATTLFTPCFREIEEECYEIRHIENAYSYLVKGKLIDEENINVGNGIIINTQHIFEGDSYLVGKFIELKIEQLCAEFL